MITTSNSGRSSALRILYITPFLQHPSLQGPTRHYYFIRELSKLHQITLLTPVRSEVADAAISEMSRYTQQIHTFTAPKMVSSPSKFMSGLRRRLARNRELQSVVHEMKQAFDQLVKESQYDLVLFHGKSMFPVIENFSGLPMVVDFCDATSLRLRGRMKYAGAKSLPWLWLRYFQVRSVEKKLVRKTPHQAFITSRDRDAIVGHDANVRIIPNVVDLAYWKRTTYSPESNCIMYSGGMDYRPNVDGALFLMRTVIPLLRRRRPDITVFIVGRDPTPEIIEAARQCPEVTITGAVADMRPYFEKAAVYVCPLRFASGQQNKLIEAMAMEVPTVCSSVAAKGMTFDGASRPPLVVADDAPGFATSIVQLLDSPHEQRRMATDGRRYIEDHFVSGRTVDILQEMCRGAVESVAMDRSGCPTQ